MTSKRLLNMSIEVLYLPPKFLYPQNKFLATPPATYSMTDSSSVTQETLNCVVTVTPMVTPSTFSDVTRAIPCSGGGGYTRRLFRLSMNTSADLVQCQVKLTRDHASILLISRSPLSLLQAGITRYVSSAYFTIMFPGVTACRSAI